MRGPGYITTAVSLDALTMTEIDLEALSMSAHGYTVNDEDDDDPVLFDQVGNHVEPWCKRIGARHGIVFEGRDAAGKAHRINAMRQLLAKFDYDEKDDDVVGEPDPLIVGRALED
jgi:polyphosphate kinase 2 (PPK2 family)